MHIKTLKLPYDNFLNYMKLQQSVNNIFSKFQQQGTFNFLNFQHFKK
jgi:hypothetical protein